MAVTVSDLMQRMIWHLNEDGSALDAEALAALASLPAGDGSADILTSPAGLLLALNNAKNRLCRTCVAARGAGVVTLASAVGWADLTAFTPADNSSAPAGWSLRWASTTSFAGTVLRFCGEDVLALQDSAYLTPAGAPAFWYRTPGVKDTGAVGVYQVSAAGGILRVDGLVIPPDLALTGSAATLGWLDSSRAELLALDAAIDVAEKTEGDEQIALRIPAIRARRDGLAMEAYAQLSPELRGPGCAFPVPPVMVGTK